MKTLITILGILNGGYMLLDGVYVLLNGKYFGPKKPGPWSSILKKWVWMYLNWAPIYHLRLDVDSLDSWNLD